MSLVHYLSLPWIHGISILLTPFSEHRHDLWLISHCSKLQYSISGFLVASFPGSPLNGVSLSDCKIKVCHLNKQTHTHSPDPVVWWTKYLCWLPLAMDILTLSPFLSFVGARGESGNEASFLVGSYINEEKSYLLPTWAQKIICQRHFPTSSW